MTQQMIQQKRVKWSSTLSELNSLRWLDTVISFAFRFLAKLSEPLLAIGIVISAIDFLQKGSLLAHNPSLGLDWSIAQGLAMEVSIGPVLDCALQAKEDNDPLKARLYTILTITLAVVGGLMLFMQLEAAVAGVSEAQIPGWVLFLLFVARTVASIGYIGLSCTKHRRFSGVAPVPLVLATDLRADMEALSLHVVETEERMQAIGRQVEEANLRCEGLPGQIMQSLHSLLSKSEGQVCRTLSESEGRTEERIASIDAHIAETRERIATLFVRITQSEQDTSEGLAQINARLAVTEEQIASSSFTAERVRSVSAGVNESRSGPADKKAFVIAHLQEHPSASISDISRAALTVGLTIAPSYISEQRKAWQIRSTAGEEEQPHTKERTRVRAPCS